ncbi:MAG: zf-HC2 domain-containing protein [Planctomycetes bacterium]|nr:zf-HC2 domain-containing protein [Planctomycetota bacterium]
MMDYDRVYDLLGPYLDAELAPGQTEFVRSHLAQCPACRGELDGLAALAGRLSEYASAGQIGAPAELWTAVERRLDAGEGRQAGRGVIRLLRQPLALAASVALLIGAAVVFTVTLDRGARRADAAVIDYSVLMDGIVADVHGAIRRFLGRYDAQAIEPAAAPQVAPGLSFNLPPELPDGYRLVQAYRVRFGDSPGLAATYNRDGEPLFIILHDAKLNTNRGQSTRCMIGDLNGMQDQVGPWRLLHVMGATTCHCVLSTMPPGEGLEAVVRAIAPDVAAGEPHQMH